MAIGCMVLVSCSLNTGYTPKRPIQAPSTWHTKDDRFVAKNINTTCYAWWKSLHDPILEQLINEGLAHNNDIQIAIANIEAARGELKRIKLNWIPGVGSNLGYSSFPYLGYPGVLALLVPTYTMNIFSQFYEQKRAQYRLAVTENIKDSIKLAVIAEIAANYFSYLAQVEQLHLLSQIKLALVKEISIYQSAYHGGLSSDIDVAKLKSHLDFIKAEEMIIHKNIVIHQNAIRFLVNKNPGELNIKRRFRDLSTQYLVIGSLPINVIDNRPDMLQATNELKAANAGANIAVSNFLPTVQLSMARGDIATIPNGTTLGQPVYFNQALLQTPLLTLSTFGDWDKAKGLSKASYYRYQNTLRRVLREINDDLASHEYFSQRLTETINAEQHFNEAYQLDYRLYQKGIVSYAQLIDEKIKLNKIKIKVNQRKLEQLISIVHLYQDLAVGYGCASCVREVTK